ncbi:hypothetical protein N2152v2_008310 [Parachlorella kessleri]
MEVAQHFWDARVADVQAGWSLLQEAISQKTLPAWDKVPANVLYSSLSALIGVQLLVTMLTSRGRRIVFDTVETILAIILILILLAVVIGLPLGIVFLTLKAASFLFGLALRLPLVASVVATVSRTLGY